MLMWRLYTIFIKVAITQVVSVAASAPAIAGYWFVNGLTDNPQITSNSRFTGPFSYRMMGNLNADGFSNAPTAAIDFDASRCSDVYGASTTVRPLSQTCRLSIKY